MAKESDIIVFAAGVGKASNKTFLRRQNQVLDVLKPYRLMVTATLAVHQTTPQGAIS